MWGITALSVGILACILLEGEWVSSLPTVQLPDVTRPTFPSLPEQTTTEQVTTEPAVTTYPEPMVCGDCPLIDQDQNSSCGASTLCYSDKPLCMTSFYSDGNMRLTQVKRCAAVSECWDLWYNTTRLREDCMGSADPYSWDGTKSGECHYCCHTPQGQAYSWCNQAMWPTKPKNLVDMNDYQRRVLDSQKTTVEASTAQIATTAEDVTTEQATTDAATTEQPTTERTTDAATTEQATEVPTTEQPTTDAPTTEQPTTEQPTTEQPTTEQPTTEQPTTEQPTTEQPTTEQPTTDAPTTEQPTTDAPTTEQVTTEQPTTDAPTTEQPTTNQASIDYPEPMVCGDCPLIDQDQNSSCGASTLCYSDKPLCMTSFYSDGNMGLTQVKRCAAANECWDLWYNKTRLRQDCMGSADPYSWDGTKSGECHYCCHTPKGQAYSWCNQAMWPTKPNNLVDMNDYQIVDQRGRSVKTITTPEVSIVTTIAVNEITTEVKTSERVTTEQLTTKQVTTAPPATQQASIDYPEPMVCGDYPLIDQDQNSSCGASTLCYSDKPLCMTSFYSDGNMRLTQVKRCAAVSECWDLWYNTTRLREDCMGSADPYSWDGTKSGECHYCCHTPQGQAYSWCNQAMWPTKPNNLVDMNDYQTRVLDPRMTTVQASTTSEATTAQAVQTQTTGAITNELPTTDQETDVSITVQATDPPATTEQATNAATTEQATDAPTTEQATDAPTTEQETDAPTAEQATDAPTTEQATDAPTTEQATDAPTAEQTTDAPTTEQATDAPTTEQATDAPTTEQASDAPTTEQAIDTPTTEQATDAPTTEQATDAPTTEQATDAPTTEQASDAPTTEQATTEQVTDAPTTEQATDAPTTEQATDAPTTEQATEAPTTEQATDAPTTEQATDAPTTEQATDAPTTEQATDAPTTEQATDAPTTEQATDAPTTEQATDAPTTEQATDAPTTEQATDAPTTEQATDLPTTEQATDAPTTEQATDAPTTEQATDAPTTEQATDAPTTEQATDAPTTEQATEAPTTEQATDAPTTEQATDLPTTEQATDAPTTEQATEEPTTEQATDAPTTEQATDAPTTEQATDAPTTEQATEESATEQDTDAAVTTEQPTDAPTTAGDANTAATADLSVSTTIDVENLETNETTTTAPEISETTTPTPSLRCEVCEASSGSGSSSCQTGRVETCSDGLDYCINTVTFGFSNDGSPANSISKKCASYQTCQSSNINQAICSGDLTDPTAFPPGTTCNFCCNDTSGIGVHCNANIRPDNTIDFLDLPTTELPTTTAAPVLTNRSCLQCGDPLTGKPCGPGDLLLGTSQPCPSGQDFCMNDIYEKAGDGKTIYKRCVAEEECRNKWFKESSDSSECTEYNPRAVVASDLTCHFCCTSDGCNIPTKPDESTLWTPFYTGN